MASDWLWVVFTLVAALAQTARNSMQKGLTASLGTLGATHVRFLYGLPFALVFWLALIVLTGRVPGVPSPAFFLWVGTGALAQIAATALLLSAMRSRSFTVSVAYTKAEPVFVLLFAWIALMETVGPWQVVAILVATLGVMVMSWPAPEQRGRRWAEPVAFGLGSGALFGVSAVGFAAGIRTVGSGSFMVDATTALVAALTMQAAVLSLYLFATDREVMVTLLRTPRQSAPGGFFGALASLFWFFAFALASPALVRALAMVEVLFSQVASRRIFKEHSSLAERAGILALVLGVTGLLLL